MGHAEGLLFLDKFEIGCELGSGSFGTVHAAVDTQNFLDIPFQHCDLVIKIQHSKT